jgi:hypothetical protein
MPWQIGDTCSDVERAAGIAARGESFTRHPFQSLDFRHYESLCAREGSENGGRIDHGVVCLWQNCQLRRRRYGQFKRLASPYAFGPLKLPLSHVHACMGEAAISICFPQN